MVRPTSRWLAIVGIVLAAVPSVFADAPPPAPLETTLALQKAMAMAKIHLRDSDPQKAVEVLEQNLAKVNGNSTYLELLRDAYRAYIKELGLKNQSAAAQRYLQRLVILDPAAANDPTLRTIDPPQFVPAAKDVKPLLPNFSATQTKAVPPPKVEVTPSTTPVLAELAPGATPIKAPVIRAIREMPGDDPFDPSNQRGPIGRIASMIDPARSASLLQKGNEEFDRKRYAEARACYEQFVKLDGKNLDQVRDRLAYCIFDGAVEQLNRGGNPPIADIRQQVTGALALVTDQKLKTTGDWLLREIDNRGRTTTAAAAPEPTADPPLNMQHYGKNPQGWQVTETTNFRIFHNQNRDFVERVALIAERTKLAMSRKWLGSDGETWSPKCELVLHASAADYARLTNVPATSPGHSRIETDPVSFRVVGRRIDLHTDTLGMLEAVLPHETTHVVLAGQFGQHQVPRWADEGVAVLTEPTEKVEQHRRNLAKGQKDGTVLPVRDLMNLQNYPDARQITSFYAQSVVLVDFLTQQRGPTAFTEFLREGLNGGYEPALRKHYGWTFTELQTNLDRHTGRLTTVAGRK